MSGQEAGADVDVSSVVDPATDSGVAHGAELVAYVDAFASGDHDALQGARDDLIAAVGPDGFVDAAGVVANFQQMNRIANGTGVASEGALATISGSIRDDLDLDSFASAKNTPKPNAVVQVVAKVMSPFAKQVFRMISK